MSVDRTAIVKGPGLVTLGSVAFHSKDGITSELETETERLPSDNYGELSDRIMDQIGKTTLTPVGVVTAAILAKLYPSAYQTPVIGTSVFGSSDEACTVHSEAGELLTWHNSALTNMPELYLSARKTAFGQAEITHLLKNSTERNAANSMFTLASSAYSDSGFSEANIKLVKYTGTWGTTLTGMQAAEGWTVTPELNLEARVIDDYGTIDYYLQSVRITAKCRPIGLDESDIMDNLPSEQNIGSIPATQSDLTITGGSGNIEVVLKNASLMKGPLKYGNTELRAGELMFIANPDVTSDGALFTVGLAAA